jgi:hypothetical protein
MMRISRLLALTASVAMIVGIASTPVSARQVELAINDDEAWDHSLTDLALPTAAAGFDRIAVLAIGDGELDVSGQYSHEASGSIATIYIYRPGFADVSIWHDRAVKSIAAANYFGRIDMDKARTTLFAAAPDATPNSAIRTVLPLEKGYNSTGVALAPYGDWFVKIRLSSKTYSMDELDAKMAEIFSSLSLPAGSSLHPAAYTIQQCEKPLSKKKAKRVKANKEEAGAASILQALLGTMVEEKINEAVAEEKADQAEGTATAPVRPVFCVDPQKGKFWSAYQASGNDTEYWMALGDSTLNAFVGSASMLEFMSGKKGQYQVTLTDSARRMNFRPFRSMPNPKQVAEVAFGENPSSSTVRSIGDDDDGMTIILE